MANGLYLKAKQAFLSADIDLLVDDIKLVLVDSADYTASLSTHEFLSDVTLAARVATSANLSGKSVTNGVFDATDTLFASASGDPCEAYIVYQDTGVEATSRLIAYFDTATGLPITPNGADINLSFDAGSNKIFSLA